MMTKMGGRRKRERRREKRRRRIYFFIVTFFLPVCHFLQNYGRKINKKKI